MESVVVVIRLIFASFSIVIIVVDNATATTLLFTVLRFVVLIFLIIEFLVTIRNVALLITVLIVDNVVTIGARVAPSGYLSDPTRVAARALQLAFPRGTKRTHACKGLTSLVARSLRDASWSTLQIATLNLLQVVFLVLQLHMLVHGALGTVRFLAACDRTLVVALDLGGRASMSLSFVDVHGGAHHGH